MTGSEIELAADVEEDITDAETIVYEDGKAVAYLNCSPATIVHEIVEKTCRELGDWLVESAYRPGVRRPRL